MSFVTDWRKSFLISTLSLGVKRRHIIREVVDSWTGRDGTGRVLWGPPPIGRDAVHELFLPCARVRGGRTPKRGNRDDAQDSSGMERNLGVITERRSPLG